jgi:hypothetical protein
MSFKVQNTERFAKELKRLIRKFPSLKSEFVDFILSLEEDPCRERPSAAAFTKSE